MTIEQELFAAYRPDKEKLIDYADDLVKSEKYIKNNSVKLVSEEA